MKHEKEIWVIDDHQLFSAGIKQMLVNMSDEYKVQCFEHPEDAVILKKNNKVSLIIMDFYIPDAEPLQWIKRFVNQQPDTPVIIISSSISPSDKKNSLEAGASAYYPKHAPPEDIMLRLQQFIDVGVHQPDTDVELVDSASELTSRQMDILIQLARGSSNKKIAQILGVSPETVKSHVTAIYRIINCETRDQAIEWARSKGFV